MPIERHDLKEVLCEILDEHYGSNPELHEEHHRFVQTLLEKERHREEIRTKVESSVYGWLLITILGGLGLIVWNYFKSTVATMVGK